MGLKEVLGYWIKVIGFALGRSCPTTKARAAKQALALTATLALFRWVNGTDSAAGHDFVVQLNWVAASLLAATAVLAVTFIGQFLCAPAVLDAQTTNRIRHLEEAIAGYTKAQADEVALRRAKLNEALSAGINLSRDLEAVASDEAARVFSPKLMDSYQARLDDWSRGSRALLDDAAGHRFDEAIRPSASPGAAGWPAAFAHRIRAGIEVVESMQAREAEQGRRRRSPS